MTGELKFGTAAVCSHLFFPIIQGPKYTAKLEQGKVMVPKGSLFLLLAIVITIAVTHLSLWLRGVRPSKRAGLWEWMSWEVFPKDEQTKNYLLQRFWTSALVLSITIAILWLLSER